MKDVTGTLVAAGALSLVVSKPDGTVQNYNSPTVDGVGLYHQDVPASDLTQVGHYSYKWVSTGAGAGVSFSTFDVFDPFDPSLLSLADAKDTLNIPQTNTQNDIELQVWIDTIDEMVEKFTGGPIFNRSITERIETAWDDALVLHRRPLVSVTSVTDTGTGLTISTSDFELDTRAGIIRRKLGIRFGGQGTYTVVYVAGWGTVVPAPIGAAARIILAHMWETQHGPTLRPQLGGNDETPTIGYGFAVPSRAMELLNPYAGPLASAP